MDAGPKCVSTCSKYRQLHMEWQGIPYQKIDKKPVRSLVGLFDDDKLLHYVECVELHNVFDDFAIL